MLPLLNLTKNMNRPYLDSFIRNYFENPENKNNSKNNSLIFEELLDMEEVVDDKI